MKRVILLLSLLTTLVFPLAVGGQAGAVDLFKKTCDAGNAVHNSQASVCYSVGAQRARGDNPVVRILKAAINVISYIVGAAAIIGLIVSGLRMIVANGDAQAVASARSGLVNSLVGVAVVALAQSIVIFVLSR